MPISATSTDGCLRSRCLGLHALVREDEATDASSELLRRAAERATLHVPSIWPWELMNSVAMAVRGRESPLLKPVIFSSSLQHLIFGLRPLLRFPPCGFLFLRRVIN